MTGESQRGTARRGDSANKVLMYHEYMGTGVPNQVSMVAHLQPLGGDREDSQGKLAS